MGGSLGCGVSRPLRAPLQLAFVELHNKVNTDQTSRSHDTSLIRPINDQPISDFYQCVINQRFQESVPSSNQRINIGYSSIDFQVTLGLPSIIKSTFYPPRSEKPQYREHGGRRRPKCHRALLDFNYCHIQLLDELRKV